MKAVRRMLPRSALGTKCETCRTLLVGGGTGGKRRSTVVPRADGSFYCKECARRRGAARNAPAMRDLSRDVGPVGRNVHPVALQLGNRSTWTAALLVEKAGDESGKRERVLGPRCRTSEEARARAAEMARSYA